MIFRLVEKKDIVQIAKIHTDNRRSTYEGILPEEWLDYIDYDNSECFWSKFCECDDRDVVVCEKNEEIIGFSAFKFFDDDKNLAVLSNLHVKEGWQNKGIGSELIKITAGILVQNDITRMNICYVCENEKAGMLYKKLGAEYVEDFVDIFQNDIKVNSVRLRWNQLEEIAVVKVKPRVKFDYEGVSRIVFSDNKEFYIFGAGKYGKMFLEEFAPEYKPCIIFDNGNAVSEVNGIPVVKAIENIDNVIITSRFYSDIEKQLIDIGCVSYAKFYPWHSYLIDKKEN